MLLNGTRRGKYHPNVLIDQVEKARITLQNILRKRQQHNAVVYSLYGKQLPEEQQDVFKKLPAGQRKIIFATDVAETSLTIDGIRHVVDSGLTKDTVYDSKRSTTSLKVILKFIFNLSTC